MESKHQIDDAHSLTAMAPEILQRIFSYFNDDTLLRSSHVCKLFASLAKMTFKRKYAKQQYIVSPKNKVNRGFHKVILNRFGEGLQAIAIYKYNLFFNGKFLMDSLIWNCHNIRKLELLKVTIDLAEIFLHLPDLSYCSINRSTLESETWSKYHLAQLSHFEIGHMAGLKCDQLKEFLNNNAQIQILSVDVYDFDVLPIIHNHLNMLKILKMSEYAYPTDLVALNLCSLESLELCGHGSTHQLYLFKNGHNNLKHLTLVFMKHSWLHDFTVTAICSFNELINLKILYGTITADQMKLIGQSMPNLASLHFHLDSRKTVIADIFAVLEAFPALTSLVIVLNKILSPKLFNYDFLTRFQAVINRPNVKLNLLFREDELVVSNDKILKVGANGKRFDPITIHWTGYEAQNSISKFTIFHLNEKCLWRLFEYLDLASLRILHETCNDMKLKVQKYLKDTFELRAFNIIAEDNQREWYNIFESFGQYFRMINLEIPSTVDQQVFLYGLINRYCKNLCELNLMHNGSFYIVKPHFSLPNLRKLNIQKPI